MDGGGRERDLRSVLSHLAEVMGEERLRERDLRSVLTPEPPKVMGAGGRERGRERKKEREKGWTS